MQQFSNIFQYTKYEWYWFNKMFLKFFFGILWEYVLEVSKK